MNEPPDKFCPFGTVIDPDRSEHTRDPFVRPLCIREDCALWVPARSVRLGEPPESGTVLALTIFGGHCGMRFSL